MVSKLCTEIVLYRNVAKRKKNYLWKTSWNKSFIHGSRKQKHQNQILFQPEKMNLKKLTVILLHKGVRALPLRQGQAASH